MKIFHEIELFASFKNDGWPNKKAGRKVHTG